MKHEVKGVGVRDVYEGLPHHELIGICQMALGQPVCAADVPTGVIDPTSRQAPMLLRELGRRVAVGEIRVDMALLRTEGQASA